MRPCNRIFYPKIYWRLNMFRAAYLSSSGTPNCICSLWFIYPCGVYKPEAANTVWSSWRWAVCCSKHVEPSIHFGIINSITRLHLVGYFYWCILRCKDPWILNPQCSVSSQAHKCWQKVVCLYLRWTLSNVCWYTVRSLGHSMQRHTAECEKYNCKDKSSIYFPPEVQVKHFAIAN